MTFSAGLHIQELEEPESARRLFLDAERQRRSRCFSGFGPSECLKLAGGIEQGRFAGDAVCADAGALLETREAPEALGRGPLALCEGLCLARGLFAL